MNLQTQHPLFLYPVLKRLMGKLKFPELLVFREVCSTLKLEVDSRLENKISIKLSSLKELEKFTTEISASEFKIASKFELERLNLDSCLKFFEAFGPNITILNLNLCNWKSCTLRTLLFKKLPNLQSLEVSTDKNAGQWLEPLIPMSFIPYGSFSPLTNLRELIITGDYSNRTDLFYDLLKSSPNLEIIHLSKYLPSHDDLFGTWLTEIILSCDFYKLKSLQLECTLIQQQIKSLTHKDYPLLRRLCIDLDSDAVENNSIDNILHNFHSLESVEFGVENVSQAFVQSIILKFKNCKCWIAIHSATGSKIIFPNHEYVLD